MRSDIRPLYHFTPRRNWMNDPNGCVFFNDQYHLYFQHHPYSCEWGPMHWGHAVSRDLMHWEEKPVALYPDPEWGYIYSGSIIYDGDNCSGLFEGRGGLIAYYTTHKDNPELPFPQQQQCISYSFDGDVWVPYSGNPILPNTELQHFRDPKVFWSSEKQVWLMLVVSGAKVILYRSRDLIHWTEMSSYAQVIQSEDEIWECPDLVEFRETDGSFVYLLIISVVVLQQTLYQVYYRVMYFEGDELVEMDNESFRLLDHGFDFYATQSWYNLPDGDPPVYIAWTNHWSYATKIANSGWCGMMSLPRELSLDNSEGSYRLVQTPVSHRFAEHRELSADQLRGYDGAIQVELSLKKREKGLNPLIMFVFDSDECVYISYNYHSNQLYFDRSLMRIHGKNKQYNSSGLYIKCEDLLKITVIYDISIMECYINDGEYTMTNLTIPKGNLVKVKSEIEEELRFFSLNRRRIS